MKLRILLFALSSVLSADGIINLGYGYFAHAGAAGSCSGSISSSENYQRLDVDQCDQQGFSPAWASAETSPWEVSIQGRFGYMPTTNTAITVNASAIWNGAFLATGSTGQAFINFGLRSFVIASNESDGLLSIPSLGLYRNLWNQAGSLLVPVTFGVPIDYSLHVGNLVPPSPFDYRSDLLAIFRITSATVVDASGAPIAGASASPVENEAFSVAASLAEVPAVPEPSSWLLLLGALGVGVPAARRRLTN